MRAVQQVVAEIEPDAVVIWGMWNMSRLVAAWAEKLAQSRVVYYLADTWPALPSEHEAYWDDAMADGPLGKALKRTLRLPVRLMLRKEWRPFSLRFEHVLVCSQSVRKELLQAGLDMHHAQVLYHGIDPAPYREAAKQRAPNSGSGTLRVVYVGSLLSHKGVHTAIEAIGQLAQSGSPGLASLTVLGSGHPEYEAHLHQLVERWQVEDVVSFHSPIPRSELPAFLARFDVLVLPSTYEEPLARITQEAMAAGLVLVGTLTGGTKEILVDGENGLAFAAEDARGLAAQLQRLSEDPGLQLKLTQAAWQTVTERFTVSRLIDQLEVYLSQVAAGQRSLT
jgi:glycosyltransferase involved in cell wall biosynthesis